MLGFKPQMLVSPAYLVFILGMPTDQGWHDQLYQGSSGKLNKPRPKFRGSVLFLFNRAVAACTCTKKIKFPVPNKFETLTWLRVHLPSIAIR